MGQAEGSCFNSSLFTPSTINSSGCICTTALTTQGPVSVFAHLGHVVRGCSRLIRGGFPLPHALSCVAKLCCMYLGGMKCSLNRTYLLPPPPCPGSKHLKYGWYVFKRQWMSSVTEVALLTEHLVDFGRGRILLIALLGFTILFDFRNEMSPRIPP